jgi:hypothetical protein
VIVEHDTALTTLVGTALPGVPVYSAFDPRAGLTAAIIARVRFAGLGKQDHRATVSSVTQQWAVDLMADQALADAATASTMDGYLDDLIGALLGASPAATFDGIKIDALGAGINEAESALQFSVSFSFNAVIRRT